MAFKVFQRDDGKYVVCDGDRVGGHSLSKEEAMGFFPGMEEKLFDRNMVLWRRTETKLLAEVLADELHPEMVEPESPVKMTVVKKAKKARKKAKKE